MLDKQGINRSNIKIAVVEPENVGWKICSLSNFHPARFFFIQLFFLFLFAILRSVKPIQHFVQHGIFVMLDEMLDRFNKALNKLILYLLSV